MCSETEHDRYRAGTGSPLLLLHGLGGTWRAWRAVLPALEARHDVLAPTLPGHLGARAPAAPWRPTAAALTDWIERELDRAGMRAAHVVGNSLGGGLALELARRGRALSVMAIAPIGLLEPDEARRLLRRLRLSHAVASRLGPVARTLAGPRFGRRLLFGDVLHDPSVLYPEEARQWVQAFVGCSGFAATLDALASEPPPALPRSLNCPASIVWPAEDRMTPEHPFADRFAAALPGAARRRILSAGHIPMPEAPERVAEVILELTLGVSPAAAART